MGLKFYLPDGNWICHVGDKFSLIIPNRPISIFTSLSDTKRFSFCKFVPSLRNEGATRYIHITATWRKHGEKNRTRENVSAESLLHAVYHTVAFHSRHDKYDRRYKRRIMTIELIPYTLLDGGMA